MKAAKLVLAALLAMSVFTSAFSQQRRYETTIGFFVQRNIPVGEKTREGLYGANAGGFELFRLDSTQKGFVARFEYNNFELKRGGSGTGASALVYNIGLGYRIAASPHFYFQGTAGIVNLRNYDKKSVVQFSISPAAGYLIKFGPRLYFNLTGQVTKLIGESPLTWVSFGLGFQMHLGNPSFRKLLFFK